MDWMRLQKIEKKFDLFGIKTHPIPLNPHGLRANRTSPYSASKHDHSKTRTGSDGKGTKEKLSLLH
jgi:hypothetical protein